METETVKSSRHKLYPYKPKHPMMKQEDIVEKQASDIESLTTCNRILKDHLDFLRDKLEQQEKQLELFTGLIIVLEEERKKAFNPPIPISLN